MNPDPCLIKKLINSNSIKNSCSYDFLYLHNFVINLNEFICYTVGNSNGQKYVNCFKFIGESTSFKLKNYYIKWWNTACFNEIDENTEFSSINFWVHSGMTLRKNFFNYDDRMSLYRTTFIFDEVSNTFFRLSFIQAFLKIPKSDNLNQFVFSTPDKYTLILKRKNNLNIISKELMLIELQKKFKKILQNKLYVRVIKNQKTKLFEELDKFINI